MPRFISIASHPGKTGTYFYNRLFKAKGLTDHSYQALASDDLKQTVGEQLAIGDLRGISISMPFKKSVIAILDSADVLVTEHETCNTVLIDGGRMIGHNADHSGAEAVISMIMQKERVSVLGSGSMGKMIASMIGRNVTMFSRSLGNWEERHTPADVVINATGAGTSSHHSPLERIPDARLVIDLATKDCELKQQCLYNDINYVGGMVFYKHQFMKQFRIYTGKDVTPEEFDEAEKDFRNEHT
jgi:shikimate dehydrogenase